MNSKIIDRVRKILSLKNGTHSEAEAAECAVQAARLMAEYQITEAMLRLDEPESKAEPIVRAQLEEVRGPNKRVAWREALAFAVAEDLGVHAYFQFFTTPLGKTTTIRGIGRESAIATWQYTFQYLCREVNSLADSALASTSLHSSSVRAWMNAFRVGCANRIAIRIMETSKDRKQQRAAAVAAAGVDKESQALLVIEKDQAEVDAEYAAVKRGFSKGKASSVGQVSSRSGYQAGAAAGDKVSLGKKRAALTTTRAMLK